LFPNSCFELAVSRHDAAPFLRFKRPNRPNPSTHPTFGFGLFRIGLTDPQAVG
jgi:hypothetical protein